MPVSVEVTSSSHGLGTQILVCGIFASKELTVNKLSKPIKTVPPVSLKQGMLASGH